MTRLGPQATAAIEHVQALARGGPLDRTLRITLNFHPDHEVDGMPVISAMARDGVYRSQIETGTSNGGLTAHRGGARWRWEHRIFGGAYDDAPPALRPRYGALNHRRRGTGGALRFGSAHLRLTEHVLDRATFCFPDSAFEPTDFGAAHRFDLVRLADAFAAVLRDDAAEQESGGVLDDDVEAHVHGPVVLPFGGQGQELADVEAVVLDPSYRGTGAEDAAHRLGIPVEWHEGRVLTVAELERHTEFRGKEPVDLGRAIALDGRLDARIIGERRRAGSDDPQLLKKVWHLVARFGSPLGVADAQ